MIPLPGTFGNEQEKNAQIVADAGLAEILLQKVLTPKKLLNLIESMVVNEGKYLANRDRAKNLVHPEAARLITDQIDNLL